jgi:hypothetical protein
VGPHGTEQARRRTLRNFQRGRSRQRGLVRRESPRSPQCGLRRWLLQTPALQLSALRGAECCELGLHQEHRRMQRSRQKGRNHQKDRRKIQPMAQSVLHGQVQRMVEVLLVLERHAAEQALPHRMQQNRQKLGLQTDRQKIQCFVQRDLHGQLLQMLEMLSASAQDAAAALLEQERKAGSCAHLQPHRRKHRILQKRRSYQMDQPTAWHSALCGSSAWMDLIGVHASPAYDQRTVSAAESIAQIEMHHRKHSIHQIRHCPRW